MQIFDGKREVLGEGSIAVDDAKRGAVGAMGGHMLLARETVWAMAESIFLPLDKIIIINHTMSYDMSLRHTL